MSRGGERKIWGRKRERERGGEWLRQAIFVEGFFFLFFSFVFFFFCIGPGLLLTIMPSCHVFGRFLFCFPSCHHHATGGGGAGLSLSITWGFPPRWHDGMMA